MENRRCRSSASGAASAQTRHAAALSIDAAVQEERHFLPGVLQRWSLCASMTALWGCACAASHTLPPPACSHWPVAVGMSHTQGYRDTSAMTCSCLPCCVCLCMQVAAAVTDDRPCSAGHAVRAWLGRPPRLFLTSGWVNTGDAAAVAAGSQQASSSSSSAQQPQPQSQEQEQAQELLGSQGFLDKVEGMFWFRWVCAGLLWGYACRCVARSTSSTALWCSSDASAS